VVHTAIVGGLSGEDRVVSFLIELTLRLGTPAAAGITFTVPLSHTEIADYLALNADTLSRSCRASRLAVSYGPGPRPGGEFLCALSPVAGALAATHGTDALKRGKEARSPLHPARA
jgi:hypothetical protein